MAVGPRSCGKLVYTFTTSKVKRMVFSSILSRMWFRKSRSSRMKLGTSLHRGFRTISMKLLSLWVGYVGPATVGLNFRSGGDGIFIYSEFFLLWRL